MAPRKRDEEVALDCLRQIAALHTTACDLAADIDDTEFSVAVLRLGWAMTAAGGRAFELVEGRR